MTKILDLQHLAPVTKKANGRPKRGAELVPCDVLELQVFWSAIVRGLIQDDGSAPALKDRLRASELMAKSLQMFEGAQEDDEVSRISDEELEAKMSALLEHLQ